MVMLRTVNFRIDECLLEKLDDKLKKSPYKTRTEFIVDAVEAFLERKK